MQNFSRHSSSMIVSLTKLSHQALVRSFNLFTASSNLSVRHGNKPQNGEPPFGITELYSNHS